jgi:signal transduction histidine kinase
MPGEDGGGRMRICVASKSPVLSSLLSDEEGFSVHAASSAVDAVEADLYVWDYEPGLLIADEVAKRPAGQHLLVADAKDLDGLGALQKSVCVLLKPITAFTLRAFARLAHKSWQLRCRAVQADTFRSDRDTLLQYVLEVNLKLQEYDQERNNFLARALHDFRAPLTALYGYCGLLSEGKVGEITSTQRKLLETMRDSARRLTRMAGGTLELLLEGRFEKTPVLNAGDIEKTIKLAVHEVYPMAQDKDIELDLQLASPVEPLLFEPEQIHQVLVNLLENSCKFTPRSGKIRIRCYSTELSAIPGTLPENGLGRSESGYRIDISDSGPGVSPQLAKKIFEQFASYAGSNDRSGAGLGLAICRAIIKAHGGLIWATPLESGGHFSFILPAGKVGSAPALSMYERSSNTHSNSARHGELRP